MSSKTQISCVGAPFISGARAGATEDSEAIQEIQSSLNNRHCHLERLERTIGEHFGAQIARAFLWNPLESHKCASVKSSGKERKGPVYWRLSKPVQGALKLLTALRDYFFVARLFCVASLHSGPSASFEQNVREDRRSYSLGFLGCNVYLH